MVILFMITNSKSLDVLHTRAARTNSSRDTKSDVKKRVEDTVTKFKGRYVSLATHFR